MESKSVEMQAIFSKLSDQNQELMILLARSVQYAQQTAQPSAQVQYFHQSNPLHQQQ